MTYKAVTNIREARACIKAEYPRLSTTAKILLREMGRGSDIKVFALREAVGSGLFDSITLDAAHNELQKGWDSVPAHYRLVAKIRSTPDFKDVNSSALSGVEDLPVVPVNDEYTVAKQSDKRSTYPMQKRGVLLRVAYEDYVSDALGAFRDQAGKLGRAGINTLNQFAIGTLIDDNPTVDYDSLALFDASHNNSVSGTLTHDSIEDAIAAVMDQTGLQGERIYQNPTTLLTGTANVLNGQELLSSSIMNAAASSPAGRTPADNAIKRHLSPTPVASPHVDAVATAAYVLTDTPVIELSFLNGQETPEIFREPENTGDAFKTDAVTWKVRQVFGGDVIEHRGICRITGS